MTFDDLDARFPNGLVDAELTGIALNYHTRTASMELNLRTNPPGTEDADEYRSAILTIRSFYYFSIDPPDPEHLSSPLHGKVIVDGLPEDVKTFPLSAQFTDGIIENAFYCRFYVHDWNSFVHIAGPNAEFRIL